jgi:hypothetical protein
MKVGDKVVVTGATRGRHYLEIGEKVTISSPYKLGNPYEQWWIVEADDGVIQIVNQSDLKNELPS